MQKWKWVLSGILTLGLCLIFYPYVIEYMIKPAYAAAQLLIPGMGDLNNFIWLMLPFGILFFILLGCLLIALGKVKPGGGSNDDGDVDDE